MVSPIERAVRRLMVRPIPHNLFHPREQGKRFAAPRLIRGVTAGTAAQAISGTGYKPRPDGFRASRQFSRRRLARRRHSDTSLGRSLLRALAPRAVRVPPHVAHQLLAAVRSPCRSRRRRSSFQGTSPRAACSPRASCAPRHPRPPRRNAPSAASTCRCGLNVTNQPRQGEDMLPVRHARKKVLLDPLAVEKHALLMATYLYTARNPMT